jgi:polyribonucleotide nucleotidyltransferase
MSESKNNAWMKPRTFTLDWGGRTLEISTGLVAQQANGSVMVKYGDTVVLVTATMSKDIRGDVDFFPLMVEYEERLYAAGIIKGSRFIKRETRPSDEAVLSARLVDRAIRPLFDDSMRFDIQLIVTVLCVDRENDPDVASLIGAATALMISDIPWTGPIAGCRVGQINGEWVLNPTHTALQKSDLDLFVAGDGEKTIMLEAGAKEVSEDLVFEAIQFGLKHMRPVIKLIKEIQAEIGKDKRTFATVMSEEEQQAAKELADVREKVRDMARAEVDVYFQPGMNNTKQLRKETIGEIKAKIDEALKAQQIGKDKRKDALKPLKEFIEEHIGEMILRTGKRVDGRTLTQIRPLDVGVGILPRTHGTGMFTRGETQVLTVATLAGPGAEQIMEGLNGESKKRYMHHYNFPPYSVGEVKPMRGPSRRDIGHGMLAEKALLPVLPPKESFPYTIRLVSEVFGSNGSSSMASTCGSTLALMDAGVPIKAPVAGVAMGLISNKKGDWKVLTDLQDLEDAEGGMDFKITGTEKGITAIQLDTKTSGLQNDIIKQTLGQARDGRMEILKTMTAVIAAPRPELSQYAPRVETLHINPEKIRDVIGPGGKMINKIIDECGVEIDIEQDGTVFISSANPEGMAKAKKWVENLTKEVTPGEVYDGKVTRLMDFGAFVEILPGQEGLVHVSEISYEHVNQVSDVLHVGDAVTVKVKEIDDMGRINLSMKALKEPPAGYEERPRSSDRGGRPSQGGGRRSSGPRGKRF